MSTGRSFLESIAATISATLLNLLENLLGPAVNRPVLGSVSLAELLVLALFVSLALLLHGVAAAWLRRRAARPGLPEFEAGWRPVLLHAVSRPLYALIWTYGAYFACRPLLLKFQVNLTEEPTALRVPIETLRAVVKEFVEQSPLWDRRFWNLQVTDATDRVIQLRVLASAADASKAFDLRCDLREKLIDYIQREHPGSLPRFRAEFPDGQAATVGLGGGTMQNSLPNPA